MPPVGAIFSVPISSSCLRFSNLFFIIHLPLFTLPLAVVVLSSTLVFFLLCLASIPFSLFSPFAFLLCHVCPGCLRSRCCCSLGPCPPCSRWDQRRGVCLPGAGVAAGVRSRPRPSHLRRRCPLPGCAPDAGWRAPGCRQRPHPAHRGRQPGCGGMAADAALVRHCPALCRWGILCFYTDFKSSLTIHKQVLPRWFSVVRCFVNVSPPCFPVLGV